MSIGKRGIVIIVLVIVVVAIVAETVASRYVKNTIIRNLEAANVTVSDLEVGIIRGSLTAQMVKWNDSISAPGDTANYALAGEVKVRGFNLYTYIRYGHIEVRSLEINDADLRFVAREDTTSRVVKSESHSGLKINQVSINNTTFTIRPDSARSIRGVFDIVFSSFGIDDLSQINKQEGYHAELVSLKARDLRLTSIHWMFNYRFKEFAVDNARHQFSSDSIQVTPRFSKVEFARRIGTQSTWANIGVQQVSGRGVYINLQQHDTVIMASHVVVEGVHIDAFRDKRVPFRRTKEMPLPMEWLRAMETGVEIDSLEVKKVEVKYEHFAEEAFKSGVIRFTNLSATIFSLSNRTYENQLKYVTVRAESSINGSGDIQATFLLPLDKGLLYSAEGSIRNMDLSKLNPILENAAFVRINGGQLNKLDFKFQYNNEGSTGTVKLDYEGLKLTSLKKVRSKSIDQLRTALVNTAVKNNKTKEGTIDFQRDKRRFIFHLWANSVLDGVRNAMMPLGGNVKEPGR